MRLKQVSISGFRAFTAEQVIDIDDLTVLLGKNDSGKSSLLEALDIFFNEPKGAPDNDDFSIQNDEEPIVIRCTFDSLPDQIVIDETAITSLNDEYMLDTNGDLVIKKVYPRSGKPKVFVVANHPQAENCNDLLTLTSTKLKAKARQANIDLGNIDQRVNSQIRRAIWQTVEDLDLQEIDIDLSKESAKEIWSKLRPKLPIYALFKSDRASTDQDAEAQDPMKVAVKEAISDLQAELDIIQDRVAIRVQEIADKTVSKISEMSPDLARELNPRLKTKAWDSLFSINLTGDESIPINKRGSGTRRLVLINFFRAKAELESDRHECGTIYAIEEPETSQHPTNQQMLIDALHDLSEDSGCQVLLTTHTPVLARRFNREKIRIIRLDNRRSVCETGLDDIAFNAIAKSIGILPNHDIKLFIGVEGKHDINFLREISSMLSAAGENISNLAHEESNGRVVFIPCGGSSVELWISRLNNLNIEERYIFDRDNAPPANPHYHEIAQQIDLRQNAGATHTSKRELENYIHHTILSNAFNGYPGTGADFEDVPSLFAQTIHEASNAATPWAQLPVEKQKKKISNAKKRLNSEFVKLMNPELLTQIDPNNDIRNFLQDLTQIINQ